MCFQDVPMCSAYPHGMGVEGYESFSRRKKNFFFALPVTWCDLWMRKKNFFSSAEWLISPHPYPVRVCGARWDVLEAHY